MENKIDPYRYDVRLEALARHIKESNISERNKVLIVRFKEACIRDGLSKSRVIKLLEIVKNMTQALDKDLDKVNKRDIERLVTIIQERNYSPWTRQGYKVIIKKFFKWLSGNEDYPDSVKWIRPRINRNEIRLPTQEGLITEEDVKVLVKGAKNPRDKAFISVLYESGCRVGELLTLKINNVVFDEYGALINVHGKTGSRKIRIIGSTSYLTMWIHNHPFNEDPDSALWINYGQKGYNQPMMYGTVRIMLKKLFKRCKIKKRTNAHLFRHSRATYLANHLTEFQMNQYFGWIQGSGMAATYVHLSGKETDSALLALNGIKKKEEEKESLLKPIKCSRCDNINSYDAKFCSKCAGILNVETSMKIEELRVKEEEMRKKSDDLMDKLLKDPEVMKLITEKMATMGLNK